MELNKGVDNDVFNGHLECEAFCSDPADGAASLKKITSWHKAGCAELRGDFLTAPVIDAVIKLHNDTPMEMLC